MRAKRFPSNRRKRSRFRPLDRHIRVVIRHSRFRRPFLPVQQNIPFRPHHLQVCRAISTIFTRPV